MTSQKIVLAEAIPDRVPRSEDHRLILRDQTLPRLLIWYVDVAAIPRTIPLSMSLFPKARLFILVIVMRRCLFQAKCSSIEYPFVKAIQSAHSSNPTIVSGMTIAQKTQKLLDVCRDLSSVPDASQSMLKKGVLKTLATAVAGRKMSVSKAMNFMMRESALIALLSALVA
jgi:hypothetical protein